MTDLMLMLLMFEVDIKIDSPMQEMCVQIAEREYVCRMELMTSIHADWLDGKVALPQ